MWNNVSMPISHVAMRNRHFTPIEAEEQNPSSACLLALQSALELWRLSCSYRELWHRFSASARDSGRQTSFHIEIYMRIDELKPNRYVGTKN